MHMQSILFEIDISLFITFRDLEFLPEVRLVRKLRNHATSLPNHCGLRDLNPEKVGDTKRPPPVRVSPLSTRVSPAPAHGRSCAVAIRL